MNILLGITGSVAAIYTTSLVKALSKIGNVKVVLTRVADEFSNIENIHGDVYTNSDEKWTKLGDPILHITLRDWADVMVIAPLSANTMAKIVNGLCDNLLTEVVRAWNFNKPIIACPAMNTQMWENYPTYEQVEVLSRLGFNVLPPISKKLACGDVGIGAMCEHFKITEAVYESVLSSPLDVSYVIPEGSHPGAFGVQRRHDVHTGVDLYCKDGDNVYAMEDGDVIGVVPFTGKAVGMPWWEDTMCMFVQGKYGVINYGEITPKSLSSLYVRRGQIIGKVKRVLPFGKERPDIPNHSLSMLHLEYYAPGINSWATWNIGMPKPRGLRNITERLKLYETPRTNWTHCETTGPFI